MNVNAGGGSREVQAGTAPTRSVLRFDRLLVGDRWQRDACVVVNEGGRIASIAPGEASTGPGETGSGGERVPGWTVPGVPNVHSHAFQRAMAGLAEGGRRTECTAGRGRTERTASSFWRWRRVMYAFLERLSPDDMEAVAAQLYVEMLKAGFVCVGEFHYLHHPPGGGSYDDEAETSRRIARAADAAGIGLVHMPVVYETGGFGGEPLSGGQLRFRMDLDGARRICEAMESEFSGSGRDGSGRDSGGSRRDGGGSGRDSGGSRHDGDGSRQDGARRPSAHRGLGWAVHSLRAVSRESFARIADFVDGRPSGERSPVHLHIAEQQREVQECLAAWGARPVEWLLDNAPVNERWCLVHATRVTEAEVRGIASSGAVVGLCPSTEANLGDGLFPLGRFAAHGGRFGIGSDSHVSRSPVEELRLLEYGQRLARRTRSVLPSAGSLGGGRGNVLDGTGGSLDGRSDALDGAGNALDGAGGALLAHAWRDGGRALGWDGGQMAPGRRADFVVLDADHPALAGRGERTVLDSWVFSGTESPVRHVFVGGVRVIEDGRHPREEEIVHAFRETAKRLGPT